MYDLDFSIDVMQALLWQHNDAVNIQELLAAKSEWYNINNTQFWENWYRDVFNVDTANRFGLTVWSIILNIDLSIILGPSRVGKPTFGFGPKGNKNKNFGRGNWSSKYSSLSLLTIDQARLLIKLRYRKLISRATVPETNQMLKEAFGGMGNVYVLDPLDMTYIVYVFDFEPGSQIRRMLEYFDVLPRPSGVGVVYRVVTSTPFGFGEENKNFKDSNFYDIERGNN